MMKHEANCRMDALWHCDGGDIGRPSIRTDPESADCGRAACGLAVPDCAV